jgi:hypothetical protein
MPDKGPAAVVTLPGKIHSAKRAVVIIESQHDTPACLRVVQKRPRGGERAGELGKRAQRSASARALCTRNDTLLAALCATTQPNFNNPCLVSNSVVTSYRRWPYGLRLPCTGRNDEGAKRKGEAGAGVCGAAGLVGTR